MLQLSGSRRNSEHSPMLQARKKLLSLKAINPYLAAKDYNRDVDQKILQRIEKSLAKHNLQQQPLADPSPLLPSQENSRQEDRLWRQFTAEAIKVATKIQREKVNYYQKFYWHIRKEYFGLQQARRNCISGLEGAIKEKYRQIHCYFEEIKQQKTAAQTFNVTSKTNKKNKKLTLPTIDNNAKIETLKLTIEDLRKQVAQIEKQRQMMGSEVEKFSQEWAYLLKKLLKQGYYLIKGVFPILQDLFQMKAKLTVQDMPQCLDYISKSCLLAQFNKLKNKQPSQKSRRANSESHSKMASIANKELIRDVYRGTKQYIINLVKQAAWVEPLILPQIKQVRKQRQQAWQQNQKKRLLHVYTGQKYERARSILFGPKVQTNG